MALCKGMQVTPVAVLNLHLFFGLNIFVRVILSSSCDKKQQQKSPQPKPDLLHAKTAKRCIG